MNLTFPLEDIPSFYTVNCTTQLSVFHRVVEGTLNPIIYAIDKDIEEHWSQDRPWVTPLMTGLNLNI